MTKKLLFVVLGSLALVACSTQQTKTTSEAMGQVGCNAMREAVVGGWQQGKITPSVTLAAEAAVKEIAGGHHLDKILHVTQQVVAGMNYNVTFSIENGDVYTANVFHSLKDTYTVNHLVKADAVANCDITK